MLVKIHYGSRMVVAVCDSNLIDKKLEDKDGKRQLDLTGVFFRGEEKDTEEVKKILIDAACEDACFNLVGKESVGIGRELGVVTGEGVLEVDNVPVSLVLL